jgi:hypothetical protein
MIVTKISEAPSIFISSAGNAKASELVILPAYFASVFSGFIVRKKKPSYFFFQHSAFVYFYKNTRHLALELKSASLFSLGNGAPLVFSHHF